MKARLRRFVLEASLARWISATTAANIVVTVLTTAIVTLLVSDDNWLHRIAYGGAGTALLVTAAALTGAATRIREARFPENSEIVLKMIRAISAVGRRENELRKDLGISATDEERRRAALAALKAYMAALEEVFATSWSTLRFGVTTRVEVVLMKRASDGEVTVASWATTRPTSLDRRRIVPDFYSGTEAAKLYRRYVDQSVRAPIWLIPDISKYAEYDHFGRDPSLRTNSTALFPLYDSASTCHGFVAVTATNRAGMFREQDRDFWIEAWRLWEPHLIRCIIEFEATGQILDEEGNLVN